MKVQHSTIQGTGSAEQFRLDVIREAGQILRMLEERAKNLSDYINGDSFILDVNIDPHPDAEKDGFEGMVARDEQNWDIEVAKAAAPKAIADFKSGDGANFRVNFDSDEMIILVSTDPAGHLSRVAALTFELREAGSDSEKIKEKLGDISWNRLRHTESIAPFLVVLRDALEELIPDPVRRREVKENLVETWLNHRVGGYFHGG